MATAIMTSAKQLKDEFALVVEGWVEFQHASPDPVYLYLSRVYGVVRRWPKEDRVKNAQGMLRLADKTAAAMPEPFTIVIWATSNPRVVDDKRRNRWARALQFADQNNVHPGDLETFIRKYGGLAKCARMLGH